MNETTAKTFHGQDVQVPLAGPATEAASRVDRLFFTSHPDAHFYLRPPLRGELEEMGVAEEFSAVLIREVQPGVRLRQPITLFPIAQGSELPS
jgi:hypothetical protein